MKRTVFIVLVLLVMGCKEKFISPAPAIITGYLVVEGVVNNDGGASNIRLSRTTNLNDNSNIPETGAAVKVIDSNNNTLQLFENTPGNYSVDSIHLDTSRKYRLSVETRNNEKYLSDFAAARNNPPIDSINWVRDNDGVQLYINTHDPQNDTRYYQWEYEETWEFHSAFSTSLKYIQANGVNVGVTPRDATDPQIYTCWQSDISNTLLLGSTEKLSQDIVHLPIAHIPNEDWKLSVLYSILIKQYSWTNEGYGFLERMKKNTESVGSVFDAQPSELNGNIHCISNPGQPVIGFFNICTIRENRIFIKNTEVPGWNYRSYCTQHIVENQADSIAKKAAGQLPTVAADVSPFGDILTFSAADGACVDCTLKGTNIKPAYWP